MTRESPQLMSSVVAETVMRQLRGSLRNPETTFNWILGLSGLAFLTGVVLLFVAVALAASSEAPAAVTAMFGGGGVVSVLASMYTLTTTGITSANADHAQLRIILHSYAVAAGNLQARKVKDEADVDAINEGIQEAAILAVRLIRTGIKGEALETEPRVKAFNGSAADSSEQRKEEASSTP